MFFLVLLQAQSEDDDTGPDDVAVNIEQHDGYMEEFFNEVTFFPYILHATPTSLRNDDSLF